MNPLDLKGSEFLSLYMWLLAGGWIMAVVLRYFLRLPGGAPLRLGRRADPYEVAALVGPDSLIEATVAALFHRGVLRIEGPRIATGEELPSNAPPIERSVFECAVSENMTLPGLRRTLSPDIEHYRKRLANKGLVMDDAGALRAWLLPSLVHTAVLLLGLMKILVGISRDKPVMFLVGLVGIGILGFLYLTHRPWRSRLGDATLQDLRNEHQPLRTSAMAGEDSKVLGERDLALAVGLFGPALLVPMGYADLQQMMRPAGATDVWDFSLGDSDSSCGGDSSCSSGGSSCSSGGSSCGGGGGCGGCGGGGGD